MERASLEVSAEERGVIRKKYHSRWFSAWMAFRCRRAVAQPLYGRRALARFQGGVSGIMPAAGGKGTLLAACNDLYYREFGVTFILSMEQQSVRQDMHLHLCHPSPATLLHIERLASALEHVRLTYTIDTCVLAAPLPQASVYYTSARFLIAHQILLATNKPVLCLDIDGIVTGPVWSVFTAAMGDADVVLKQRAMRAATRKILASAVGFNTTERGRAAADAVARALARVFEMRPAYHIDQACLHYVSAAMEYRKGLRIAAIPSTLIDTEFREESVIWTAKGWKLKSSDRYLEAKRSVDADYPLLAVV